MNKTLILVNCQKDFVNGVVPINGASSCMERLTEYLQEHGADYDAIIAVLDSHPPTHSSFKREGGEWPSHCVMFTDGWNLCPNIEYQLNNLAVSSGVIVNKIYKGLDPTKEEYSAIEDEQNKYVFNEFCKNAAQIDIAGLSGEYSLYYTVKDLIELDKRGAYKEKMCLLYDYIADNDQHNKLKKLERYKGIGKKVYED